MLYGIPYPGVFVCNEAGQVTAKFFHDSYKKRDSAETYLAAALGHVIVDEDSPHHTSVLEDIKISVSVIGGNGSIRQGIIRQLLVRFELPEGLHIYGPPVPKGMVATHITVQGPDGLVVENPKTPTTKPLYLSSVDETLNVWHGVVDFVIPFYPSGALASEVRPLDETEVSLTVKVDYQACDDNSCLLPTSQNFSLQLPLDVVDIPNLFMHKGHGQREGKFDGMPHFRRQLLRKIKQNPLGLLRFLANSIKLEWAARKRLRQNS